MTFIELEDGGRARIVSRDDIDIFSLCAYGTENNPSGLLTAGALRLALYIDLNNGVVYAVIIGEAKTCA